MAFPLDYLAKWAPFRLDALGLVTLIGAEEVGLAIGTLQSNLFTDYLPLFGSFLVAEDKITKPLPGFSLYNVSDGVYVPVISGWFSRWLLANLKAPGTLLTWQVTGDKQDWREAQTKESRDEWAARRGRNVTAVVIGVIVNGGLIVVAALQGDYYGVANAVAMTVSVVVRQVMMAEKRRCLNDRVRSKETQRRENKSATDGVRLKQKRKDEELVKIIITTPEDKVAIFRIHRCFVAYVVADLAIPADSPTRQALYLAARAIAWIVFVVHVVCIGQADLVCQMLSVGILATATVLTVRGLGRDSKETGGKLRINKTWKAANRRAALLKLAPTDKEEKILRNYWHLPHQLQEVDEVSSASASDFWEYWKGELPKARLLQHEEEQLEQQQWKLASDQP